MLAIDHDLAKNKKNGVSFRLVLPAGMKGAPGVFQRQQAVAFDEGSISPETLLIHGSFPAQDMPVGEVHVTKFGIGLMFAIEAEAKKNSLFIAGAEEEEQFDMLARAFSNALHVNEDSEEDGGEDSEQEDESGKLFVIFIHYINIHLF